MKFTLSTIFLLYAAFCGWTQAGGFGGGAAPAGGGTPGAFGAAGGRAAQRPASATVGTVEVTERAFVTTVAGRMRPANSVTHPAAAAGIVSEVRVAVGQRVQAGAPLFVVTRDDIPGSYAPVIVRARVAGTVSVVLTRVNNEIRSGENGVTIIDTSEYLLTAQVSDKDAFSITVGAAVTANAAGGISARGVLVARSPEPDYQTGLFSLTFRFPGSPSLFPGQFVTVDLPVETVTGYFVAQNLLVRRYGRFFIWTVAQDNTLRLREVKTGRTHGDDIEIVDGLRRGDRILLVRRGNEREGQPTPGTE